MVQLTATEAFEFSIQATKIHKRELNYNQKK